MPHAVNAEDRLREWDPVFVSGYCCSEGRFFYRLKGVVATLTETEVKVWPLPSIGDGKLWFERKHARLIFRTLR